jgi:hypothetical protein
MVRCPVCESARVIIVISPTRRGQCVRCSARWIQEGSHQTQIQLPKTNPEPDQPLVAT